MSDPLRHRWCPVCGADTNREGHRHGCLRRKNDPEWRDPSGVPWLLLIVAVVVVVLAWGGLGVVTAYVLDLLHSR